MHLKYLFFLLIVLVIVYVFGVHFTQVYDASRPLYQAIAIGAVKFFLTSIFFLAGSIYAHEWGKIKSLPLLETIFRRLVLPYISLFWVTKYRLLSIDSSLFLMLSVFIILLWNIKVNDIIRKLAEFYPLKESDMKLFSVYPPKKRSDMILMDMAYIFICLIPLFLKSELLGL